MPLTPFIIDCDTGRDDALAIWTALAKRMPLAAIVASYGNTHLPNVIENTARVLGLAGKNDIPILPGLAAPPTEHKYWNDVVIPRQQAAGNGLCNVDLPAASRIIPKPGSVLQLAASLGRLAERYGKLDYVIIGPATNFAAVCKLFGGGITRVVSRVTMMGGKFAPLWDDIPGADFNIGCDPHAVAEILAIEDLKVRFVAMNTTWRSSLTQAEVDKLSPTTTIATAAKTIMQEHLKHFAPEPVFRFHDPCVVLTLDDPHVFAPVNLNVVLDDQDPNFGRLQLAIDNGRPAYLAKFDIAVEQDYAGQILRALGFRSAD
jgi:purine nucleosidase